MTTGDVPVVMCSERRTSRQTMVGLARLRFVAVVRAVRGLGAGIVCDAVVGAVGALRTLCSVSVVRTVGGLESCVVADAVVGTIGEL